jgi:hypothetical protein
MSTLAQLQTVAPKYTAEDFKRYAFWKGNIPYLDDLIELVSRTQISPEQSPQLKKLGKLELLLGIKESIKTTNEAIKLLNEQESEK